MTINNNDDNNAQQSSPKRGTISLKRKIDVSSSKFSGSLKTVQVEIKRKKSSGLRVDITVSGKTGDKNIENELREEEIQPRKLTDLEFQKRVRVLQDALKEEETESHTPTQIEKEKNVKEEPIEAVPTKSEPEEIQKEEIIAPLKEKKKQSLSQKSQKKKEHVIGGEAPVVFKSREYLNIADKEKQAVSNVAPPPISPTDDGAKFSKKSDLSRTKKDSFDQADLPRKRATPHIRKIDVEKKISRATLRKVIDNDFEERARSVASFKRAKQKLRNNNAQQEIAKVVREVNIPDVITISELANRMAIRGAEIIKYLMQIGTIATLNQSIDGDTAEIVCTEFGHTPKRVSESDIENAIEDIEDNEKDLLPRSPIVVVMGHVDHGKTTLLDTLRQTCVASKESGGITQHVAAYQVVDKGGKKITFIDTPGHAAFSKIRSRGAIVTDIVVLVVAADDGIKDQTIEAINHAKSQNVPIIVAINKIDKPNINIDRVKTDLMNYEIILEDFGGEVLSCEISALKNVNMDGLMETILLQAEMMQLKANSNRRAVGIILESKVLTGKGIVASAIIQHGTLRTGDIFVAGGSHGKVRALYSDIGKKLNSANPSTPVEIVGFNGAPEPGDIISVVDSEQKAREIAEYRKRIQKEKAVKTTSITMEQLIAGKNTKKFELNIVIKSDVAGSVEALSAAISDVKHDEIDVKITDSGVGMINESDIDFAKNTKSIVLGFNIGITTVAKDSAKLNMVKVYSNNVIYHIIEEVKKEMSELLPPIIEENYIGTAEVRKIFVISRFGTIAGCYVIDGVIKKSDSKIKVIREGDCVFEGKIRSMKHEKDEIKESKQSHECGILAEGFNDFLEGDTIECYEIIQKSRFVI
ncbi:MAG: translation initiation factor IF-2 [Holosporales bacterium]|jgi:translation initiation factor IF-2|nr:translation initiation factor IF-2 [Holosporales bacterium]